MSKDDPEMQFIAEFACIHEGSQEYLLELAREIRAAGANGVKFQVFSPDEVVTPDHPDYEYLCRISFDRDSWLEIIRVCVELSLEVWIDASGRFSLDVIEGAAERVSGVKIHSADIDNPVILEGLRGLDVPIGIGCGGTPLIDLFELLDRLKPVRPPVLLHGYQAFPKAEGVPGGPPQVGVTVEDLELWRIAQLRQTFPDAKVGLADHLAGEDPLAQVVPLIAAALGATFIEKHVTLDRAARREDYFSSLEPEEFRRMVDLTQKAVAAQGADRRAMGTAELGYIREMKRTVVAARDLPSGSVLSAGDFEARRDGAYRGSLRAGRAVGRSLRTEIAAGQRLRGADVDLRVGVFCNARLASSRLPEKALLPFHGDDTTVGYLLRRLVSYPRDIGEVVLATTVEPEDDALEEIATAVGVPCFRGATEDVMFRMIQTAEAFEWDVLVRVTGDDQFVSCEYIERALRHHLEHSLDYTRVVGLPVGMACEIIDVRTLGRIHEAVVNRGQTEHLTWYLDSEWTCRNEVIQADPEHRRENFRVTLDYPEDYELMREVARRAHAGLDGDYAPTSRIIEVLEELDPDWVHQETLWTLERRDVDTSLVYRAAIAAAGSS